MADSFKEREDHRGPRAVHLGQDHFEKSKIDAAVPEDRGPEFAPDIAFHEQPQQPADVTHSAAEQEMLRNR